MGIKKLITMKTFIKVFPPQNYGNLIHLKRTVSVNCILKKTLLS